MAGLPRYTLDSCCQDKAQELETLRSSQSRTLWIVLGINGAMFGLEAIAGLVAGSTALLADSLDMLGDASIYAFSLFVVARSARWKASAALLKGLVMAVFGMVVLAQVGYRAVTPDVPDSLLMGITGALALGANLACLLLLTRHRRDDLNMRSTWLCSRNDIIANLGVLAAAAAVFLTSSIWPDLVIGLLITVVFLKSAAYIVRQALEQLRRPEVSPPVVLVHLSRWAGCNTGTCPAGQCRCGAV